MSTALETEASHRVEHWLDRHRTVRRIAGWISMTWNPHDEREHQREMLMAVALATSLAGFIWSPIYAYYGEYVAASIPSGYGVVTIISGAIYRFYPRYRLWRWSQYVMFITLPPLLMLSLGGFVEGSAIVLWSMLPPLGALAWSTKRESLMWFAGFVVILAVSALLESTIRSPSKLPEAIQTLFFAFNLAVVPAIAFLLLRHFVNQQQATLILRPRTSEVRGPAVERLA
jgi:hypothetical protein